MNGVQSPAEDMAWTNLIRAADNPGALPTLTREVGRRADLFEAAAWSSERVPSRPPRLGAILSVYDDIVAGRWLV